ncbi:hypothetical protein [Adhaeribacter pallidiroseus]|nr:hypothetical protein [Adhaeribacter pallidiroseus]
MINDRCHSEVARCLVLFLFRNPDHLPLRVAVARAQLPVIVSLA